MSQELIWKPTAKQEQFLSLPDSIFEAMYGGAAGGGKSECLVMFPIVRGWYKHPRFKGIIFRRTYPELDAEVIQRSKLWYGHTGGKFNEEKKRWTWPDGGLVQFGHMEYENDARKYDSAEYNFIGFDELTSFTEFQYKYLFSRARSSSKDLPAIVRSATNPGNVGHGWVRKRFVEDFPKGTIALDKVTGTKRIFIQSMLSDNPHITANDPGYAGRLMSLPEAERRAKLDGDWWTFSGQVFSDFRGARMSDEPENALHVIDPFTIPDWWPRILAIDWGFSALTIALWGAVSPDKRVYIYREYAVTGALVSTWATAIGKLSENERITDTIMCQSAWQQRGEDATTAQRFEEFSGLRPRSSENDKGSRILGKLLLQEYIRWRQRPPRKVPEAGYTPDLADRILRTQGIEAHERYMESFKEQPPELNIPKLQIFANCPEVIKAIPLCVYEDKDRTSGKPAEDVKEFVGDDPYDCIRYLVKGVDQLNQLNLAEGEYQGRVAEVMAEFERTKNQTRMYRRMEVIEGGRPRVQPIRKFHSRRAS